MPPKVWWPYWSTSPWSKRRVPGAGLEPSATAMMANFLPRRKRSSIIRATPSMSKGFSGIRMPCAPPAIPAVRVIQPV